MTIDKIVRNWSKNAEELRRKPCKTHVSWLLIDLECCFLESNDCLDCNLNQMIARTMLYNHVIRYINHKIFFVWT